MVTKEMEFSSEIEEKEKKLKYVAPKVRVATCKVENCYASGEHKGSSTQQIEDNGDVVNSWF